jgi:biotin carboxyl carrier protein
MKFKVNVRQRNFEVEVGDVGQRPILVLVEGERFEVWPASEAAATRTPPAALGPATEAARRPATPAATSETNAQMVRAPIPGVIVSIAVQAGSPVTAGQELCVLEAMKMKNAIRAARAGTIASVLVAVGQTVKQRESLIEYALEA